MNETSAFWLLEKVWTDPFESDKPSGYIPYAICFSLAEAIQQVGQAGIIEEETDSGIKRVWPILRWSPIFEISELNKRLIEPDRKGR